MMARELMTANPYAIPEGWTVRAAAQMMHEHDVGMIPVVRDLKSRRLEGVITDRDIAVRCVADGRPLDGFVAAYMTRVNVATVRPATPVGEVLGLMEKARVRRIPVVDEDGRLVGIIALADVVRALGRQSPEMVEEVLERVCEASHALA